MLSFGIDAMRQPRTYLQLHKHRGSHNRLLLGTLQPCKSGPERISNIMIENSIFLFQSRSLVVLGCVQMCPIKIKNGPPTEPMEKFGHINQSGQASFAWLRLYYGTLPPNQKEEVQK